MKEYKYVDGAKVLDLVPGSVVDSVKDLNCYEAACEVANWLSAHGVRCSIVTFKNGTVTADGCIQVWNDYTKEYEHHTHQSIALLGDSVIDVLHSASLIKTSDYIRGLGENNMKLTIAGELTYLCDSHTGLIDFSKH